MTRRLLHRAALDVLPALDAEAAWPLIEADYRRRGAEALRDWSSLRRGSGLSVNLAEWPTDRLEWLVRMLLESFPLPPEGEPSYHTGWVGPDDELRQVRDRVIDLLIRRHLEGDSGERLLRFAPISPQLQQRLDWERQQHQAAQLLAGMAAGASPAAEGPGIPAQVVVRLLDDGDFRLVHIADDLLAAVLHATAAQVGEDAGFDVSMLYGRNEPADDPQDRPGTASPSGRKKETKIHKSDSRRTRLQAYIRRRAMRHAAQPHPRGRVRADPRGAGQVRAPASTSTSSPPASTARRHG